MSKSKTKGGSPRAQLRERIARILHDANSGSIVPDPSDPTKYGAMADALLEAGFEPAEEFEYGWAPHGESGVKFPTEREAAAAYSMAVGYPVRHWRRRKREENGWTLAEDSTAVDSSKATEI